MTNNVDIIIVGQQAWDIEIGSNCKNIAVELSKKYRVMYVNPALDRITMIRNRRCPKVEKRISVIDGKRESVYELQENLWVVYPDVLLESINWIRNERLFGYLNKMNGRRFAASIQRAIERLGFQNYYLFNDNDIFRSFHLKELLDPVVSVYYSRDNIVATHYWKRHGRTLEPELISKSDLCVANSEYLRSYCSMYNSKSFYVGQGCDFQLIRDQKNLKIPTDMSKLGHPIIGYVGALTSSRLDLNLIAHISDKFPSCSIVLVGPQDKAFANSALHMKENVFFLGAKRPEDLPHYINSFDVCINPQVLNDLTIGNYPRKVDEYLALGKPVVATKTESMISFDEHVYLAEDYLEFVNLIELALTSNDKRLVDSRRNFAYSHTWERSVERILISIESYLKSSWKKSKS